MKKSSNTPPKPVRSDQVPVTTKMLFEMESRITHKTALCINQAIQGQRNEFKSELKNLRDELKADNKKLRDEFKTDNRTLRSELKADQNAFEKTLTAKIDSSISEIKADIHRIGLLVEEQNARNKFVLDGYQQLYELIERKL